MQRHPPGVVPEKQRHGGQRLGDDELANLVDDRTARLLFAKILSPRLNDNQRLRARGAMSVVVVLLGAPRASLRTRTHLAFENLALRQQLLLRRRPKRPQFGRLDRFFWVWLSDQWAGWREALHVVRPQTVIRCHRQGFSAFCTWKSRRGRVGRPSVISTELGPATESSNAAPDNRLSHRAARAPNRIQAGDD